MLHLQAETVQLLLKRVKTGDATASELNVARQMLKDNEIAIDIEKDEGLADLHESLPIFAEGEEPWPKH
jgi:hypothetical protein